MAYVSFIDHTETSITVDIKGLSSPQNAYNRFRFRIDGGSWRYVLRDVSYTGSDSPNYTFTGLTAGTSYYIEGECETNTWYPTDPKTSYTKEAIQVPSAVTGLTVTNRTSTSISIDWNNSANADFYKIYKYVSGGTDIYVGTAYSSSYNVTGLGEYTYYRLKVVPENSKYTGTHATIWEYTKDATIPTVDFLSVEIGANQIVANVHGHDSGVGLSGFYFYLNGNHKQTVYSSEQGTYTYTGLSPNTSYTLGVQSFDKDLNVSGMVNRTEKTRTNRPSNWKWTSMTDANGRKLTKAPFTMSASEWNSFTARINEFLMYKYGTTTTFTTVNTGNLFRASYFNQAKNAIGGMVSTGLSDQSAYDQVTASKLNTLMDSLNSIV